MSRKFIQGIAYGSGKSDDGSFALTCEFEKDQLPGVLPNLDDTFIGLFVPKQGEKETWHQEVLECAINFLNTMLNGNHNFNDTKLDDPNLSIDGLNPNLIILMRLLSNIQQYSTNTKSWLSNNLKSYELSKIQSDLEVALNFVKSLQKSSQ